MGAFFTKDASLEFLPAISLKRESHAEVSLYGFFSVTLFKLSENFVRDIFAKHFDKVAGFQSVGCEFNGNNLTCLRNIYRTSF